MGRATGIGNTCQRWIGSRIPPQDRRITLSCYRNINNSNFNLFPQITNSVDLACTWDLPLCVHLTGRSDCLRTMSLRHKKDVNQEQATAAEHSVVSLYGVHTDSSTLLTTGSLLSFSLSIYHCNVTAARVPINATNQILWPTSNWGIITRHYHYYVIIPALFIAVLENAAYKYCNWDKTVANVANMKADVRLKMYLNTKR